MKEKLEKIRSEALELLKEAKTPEELDAQRIRFLGKKGELTSILKMMGSIPADERPAMGQLANKVRGELEELIDKTAAKLKAAASNAKLQSEKLDVTLPGAARNVGHLHPLTVMENMLTDIFQSMGYDVVDGPEVETVYYNFEALNVPDDHPAKDMQDTLYLGPNVLLRTQTSAAQIRTMENRKPPIRIVCPGRVFRADEVDSTHSPVFHQMEGLVVDKGITMCDLKGTLEQFAHEIYGENVQIRFRPSFFPFTEPSVEVDASCPECGGKGCRMCKNIGWIEILGAGMVHPNVLRSCGIDPEVYSGFAFGVGIERLAITKYKINDIRLFYENDLRFLEQF